MINPTQIKNVLALLFVELAEFCFHAMFLTPWSVGPGPPRQFSGAGQHESSLLGPWQPG